MVRFIRRYYDMNKRANEKRKNRKPNAELSLSKINISWVGNKTVRKIIKICPKFHRKMAETHRILHKIYDSYCRDCGKKATNWMKICICVYYVSTKYIFRSGLKD